MFEASISCIAIRNVLLFLNEKTLGGGGNRLSINPLKNVKLRSPNKIHFYRIMTA